MGSIPLVEVWRGDFLECQHRGHAVICDGGGEILEAWGDPSAEILPRSSCKMIQALPLITSGAAASFGLTSEQLALSCASHQGAAMHTDRVVPWLSSLGLDDSDLRCGPQWPNDLSARNSLVKTDTSPCRYHNNCSGKHSGFLTLSKHLGAGAEYLDIDHPVQIAVRDAFEDATGETSSGYAIDGCSAPNFSCSLHGLGRAVGRFAQAKDGGGTWDQAAVDLRHAMMAHPDLVAGTTRACTELMGAAPGVALKTGADGVFVAIIPEKNIGIAVKIEDGATRASEAVITALLTRLGCLDANHPAALKRLGGPLKNFAGLETGQLRIAAALR